MKKILITAGIHGDELGAVLIARELRGWVEGKAISDVEIIPEVNSEAVETRKRENPVDDKDLNRLFPGSQRGTHSEKLAYNLFQRALEYDLVIDLHTYGPDSWCIPYMLTDLTKEGNRRLCRKIGLDYGVQTGGTEGQLFIELSKRDIPSLIIEVAGANHLKDSLLARVKSSLQSFLNEENSEKKVEFFDHYERLSPDKEGHFQPKKNPGDRVDEGEEYGTLDDQSMRADLTGLVLGIKSPSAYDNENESLIVIAEEKP